MYKQNTAALFGAVMVLLLLPFVPAYLDSLRNDVTSVSSAAAATDMPPVTNITEVISTGYVGNYGLSKTPPAVDQQPPVLGANHFRISAMVPPYQAREVGRSSAVINLNPGKAITVWVDFLNTGSATWHNDGQHFLAVNLTEPAGRVSVFQHKFWKEFYYRPGRLLQDEVRPGEVGRFRFALQAPQTPGIYLEKFHLVAENLTWVEGGYFEWYIGVGKKVSRPPDYQAKEVSRSKGGIIDLAPGRAITFEIQFKNTGLKNWYNDGEHFIALNVTDPAGRVSPFKHDFWNTYYYRPTKLLQKRIYPGEVGTFRFALQAPNVEGYYTEKFALVAENLLWLPGGEFTLNFKVGNPPPPEEKIDYSVTNEPNIRVGLYHTDQTVEVTANGAYTVINMNTNQETTKTSGEMTTIPYSSDAYWRLTPQVNNTIMEITNFNNPPGWNSELNDNTYRGAIEIRYSKKTKKMWVINELPLESYLLGLAEVSNGQPEEYLKALIIAARSYALWHILYGGKHPDEYFDVNATTDQIYRGYGFEQRSEDPVTAVKATAGIVITHPDAISEINPQGIAIATYSSGTDGRTRNWSEVWAGSGFPWLVSVEDPYGVISNWDTLTGNHMVGMSAKGARGYATEEGRTYDWILKHYYTGASVEKIY